MKFLLAAILSTLVSASAFGACSVTSAQDCTTKAACEGLSKPDGVKFEFTTGKCMSVETSVATDCLKVNGTTTDKVSPANGAPASTGTEAIR